MDKNSQLGTLNNTLGAIDELEIKGSSAGLVIEIKKAISAVMQAIATEAQAQAAAQQAASQVQGQTTEEVETTD